MAHIYVYQGMKHQPLQIKLIVAGIASALFLSNCTVGYDAYGRPIQSVDAEAVAIGALVLGTAAFAAGQNNPRHSTRHHTVRRSHYSGHGYRGHR